MKNYISKWERLPSVDAFGSMIDGFMRPFFDDRNGMRTDVKETEKEYIMDIELPGFDKKDIEITAEDGYVTVKAEKCEKDEKDSYVRRERCASYKRSYYLGEVREDSITAKYENGVLKLNVPKAEPEEKRAKNITIE